MIQLRKLIKPLQEYLEATQDVSLKQPNQPPADVMIMQKAGEFLIRQT